MIEGNAIALRGLNASDIGEHYIGWLNDPEVTRYLETRHKPQTKESILEFVSRVNARSDEFLFGIFLKTGCHIGNIKVGPFKPNHALADVSLFIGDREYWGQGHATDAIRTISRHAINALGLQKLNAITYAENRASVGAFRRAGYTTEGMRRKHYLLGGKPADIVEFGLCKTDF